MDLDDKDSVTFIKRYPVPFFFAAAIVITYAAGIAAFLFVRKIQLWTGIELSWAGELVLKFGPSLAGILTIALTAGRNGVRDLLRRCVQWRGPVVLYVAAISLQPIILLLVLVLRGYGPQLQAVAIEAAIGAFAAQLLLNMGLPSLEPKPRVSSSPARVHQCVLPCDGAAARSDERDRFSASL